MLLLHPSSDSISQNRNIVRIYSTASGRQTQAIRHPRPIINLSWRHPRASSRQVHHLLIATYLTNTRDDLVLYTITVDSTLRVFLPVLDSPHTLQLHASLDLSSSLLSSTSVMPCQSTSNVFWLDREVIDITLEHLLKTYTGDDDVRIRVLRDIVNEGWDLFLRVLDDGSIIPSSLAVSISAYPFENISTDVPRT